MTRLSQEPGGQASADASRLLWGAQNIESIIKAHGGIPAQNELDPIHQVFGRILGLLENQHVSGGLHDKLQQALDRLSHLEQRANTGNINNMH